MSNPALSLVHGPNEPALFDLTIGQLADQQAVRYGDKDCIIIGWNNTRLSYRELSESSKVIARGLLSLGVQSGDRIAILSGDDERFIQLFFAAARIGACLVIINKTYTVPECLRALNHTEPTILFISNVVDRRPTAPILEKLREGQNSLKHIVMTRWDTLPTNHPPSTWDSILSAAHSISDSELNRRQALVNKHSTVNIQFTSGTTGSPKASMLTHFNIGNNGFYMGHYLQLVPEDVVCCGPPLFHCFGLVAGLLAAFTHGSSIIYSAPDFDAAAVVGMVLEERCTVLHGVPTMFTAVIKELEKTGRSVNTIRKGFAAGTKVPRAMLLEMSEKLGFRHIASPYGMTETAPTSFIVRVEDSLERKLETVGTALPHVSAKIVDSQTKIVPRGTRGEICVSGWHLQQGYFKNPEKTAEVMIKDEDGTVWMHTGDEGVIDEHGYLTITGRIKDIIIRGGENIYPVEIEERLLHHPAIGQASVVGLQDPRYGESVNAFLELRPNQTKPTLEELKSWVRETLGRHKAPVRVFWVGNGESITQYPVTGSGKIRKEVLREFGNKMISLSTAPASKL
ncbi:unnamed protein product [Clonostachys byssicola]|uniref:Uncharacterized protein n=1 Tax=Clonostachys byssicola TaxID=160290 RepID=A0A9N9Y0M4_9HYPO|nr:unnamed protein product [Clonostachys byssicola]